MIPPQVRRERRLVFVLAASAALLFALVLVLGRRDAVRVEAVVPSSESVPR